MLIITLQTYITNEHSLKVKDETIMVCGGEDPNSSARAACHYLDPNLGRWVKVELDVARKDASSSLFGDKGYMLITGGRRAGDTVVDSVEFLEDGKVFAVVDPNVKLKLKSLIKS